jgi:hypothetical protein
MDYIVFLQKISPFKIYIVIVLALLCLSQYYVAFNNFSYAAKKEDSPANLNAATLRGVINLSLAIVATVFIAWLFMQRW